MGDRIGGQQQISAILKMCPCPRQQRMGKAELAVPSLNSLLRTGKVWGSGVLESGPWVSF